MIGEFNYFNIELSKRKHLQWVILCSTLFGIQNGNWAIWNSAKW